MINCILKKKQLVIYILIFVVCITVYLANRTTISAGDTIPNTILAFNLLENHTFNFDSFRESYLKSPETFYYFTKSPINGHITSIYPIGTAIVTFPLYLFFFIILKLANVSVNLNSSSFEVYRLLFEKLAAATVTAFSVVLFYLCSKLNFGQVTSLVSTFIYAFATNTWMTSSQGLWQHGVSNLAVLGTMFCLLRANRISSTNQKVWLIAAGFCCGFLPGIRSTSLLFFLAALVYSVFIYRIRATFFVIGLFSTVPTLIWNFYYFGSLDGAGSALAALVLRIFDTPPYIFSFKNFINSFLGILISPSRGILIFSPVIIYCYSGAYQVLRYRFNKDDKLIGCLVIASGLLILNYFFYTIWYAGHSYGSRFMTDIMPTACYLINYYLANFFNNSVNSIKAVTRKFIIFTAILLFSTFVQTVGAFGPKCAVWNIIPLPVHHHEFRLWQFRDSQITRCANSLFNKIIKPPIDNKVYIQTLAGNVKEVRYMNNQSLVSPISVTSGSVVDFKAILENTGKSRWFGYESAILNGEVRLRARLYGSDSEQAGEGSLFVSGRPKQYELATATGSVTFPEEPGIYKLVFDFVVEGVGEFPQSEGILPYELQVKVENTRLRKNEK